MMSQRDSDELARGDEMIARLRDALENGTSPVLDAETYRDAVVRESKRCANTDETLALVEINFSRALEPGESWALSRQLCTIANNPGDLLGETAPGCYGMAFPWTSEAEVRGLAQHAARLARSMIHDADVTVKYAIERQPLADTPQLTHMASAVTINREDPHARNKAYVGQNRR